MINHIQAQARNGVKVSAKYLTERFGSKPYGWPTVATLCLSASLVGKGKCEARSDSTLLEGAELARALNNNRFTALRFMDVNGYTNPRVVSPDGDATRPELLAEAIAGNLPEGAPATIAALLDGRTPSRDPQGEAYRLLLVHACNAWHATMPFMFEKVGDYTELLMPEDLLSQTSIAVNEIQSDRRHCARWIGCHSSRKGVDEIIANTARLLVFTALRVVTLNHRDLYASEAEPVIILASEERGIATRRRGQIG